MYIVSDEILNGDARVVFAHPEDILSEAGRKVMRSEILQKNVAAYVIDKGHCVEMW